MLIILAPIGKSAHPGALDGHAGDDAPAGISERPGNGERPRAPRDAASSGHGKAAADEAASRQSEVKQRRESERRARLRQTLEGDIGRKETERAALGEQMNDPNFYLARSDAKELIANYEQLGREIERLYEELMGLDGAAPSNS